MRYNEHVLRCSEEKSYIQEKQRELHTGKLNTDVLNKFKYESEKNEYPRIYIVSNVLLDIPPAL